VVALDDAGGGDADDAAVPAFAVDYDAIRLAQGRIASDSFVDGAENAALFFLAFGIQAIEFSREQPGAVGIFHAEEFNHVAGYIHATGGVDARGDAEGNFSRVGRTLGGDSAPFPAAP